MSEAERIFFDMLNKKTDVYPSIKIDSATNYISGIVRKCVTDTRGVDASSFCYMLAVFSGLSVANYSKKSQRKTSLTKIESQNGVFWFGDEINRGLFEGPISALGSLLAEYSEKPIEDFSKQIHDIVEKNTLCIGKSGVRLWVGTHDPYEEKEHACSAFKEYLRLLEPFELETELYISVFGKALGKAVLNLENASSHKYDWLNMSVEVMTFFAHMDI